MLKCIIKYDPRADALYVKLKEGRVTDSGGRRRGHSRL